MASLRALSICIIVVLMTGCVATPQQPIALSPGVLTNEQSVMVAMSEIPEPTMTYPGADCLLCLGVAAAANGKLGTHAKTLPTDELQAITSDLMDSIEAQGVNVQISPDPFDEAGLKKSNSKELNAARLDYSPLKSQLGTSHLLVINFDYVGLSRNYSSYVATSDPYATISGSAYLVNLETNTYEWYLPIHEQNHSAGEWKEPPEYPALTNSYFESIARIRESILDAIEAAGQ